MNNKTKTYISVGVVVLVVIIIIIVAVTRKKAPASQITIADDGSVVPVNDKPATTSPSTGTGTNKTNTLLNMFGDTVKGKAAFAKTDNVTVYNSNNSPRKVLKKNEWAGTVIDKVGSLYRLYFQDATIGYIATSQAELK